MGRADGKKYVLISPDIAQKNISVEDKVYGACEIMGLDSLYVTNKGLVVAVVDASVANGFLQQLKQWKHAAQAGITGTVTTETGFNEK